MSPDTGEDAQSPLVFVDSTGNVNTAWQQDDAGDAGIYVNRYVAGSGWIGPSQIDHDNGYQAQLYGMVGSADNGSTFAPFIQSDGSHQRFYAAAFVPGTGWALTPAIDDNNGYDAIFGTIKILSNGTPLAVYGKSDGANLRGYTKLLSQPFGTEYNFDGGPGFGLNGITVSASPNGDAVIAFTQPDGSGDRAWANIYDVSGSIWTGPTTIEANGGGAISAGSVTATTRDNGDMVVAWQQRVGPNIRLYTNRYTISGGWEGVIAVDNDIGYDIVGGGIDDGHGPSVGAGWVVSDGARDRLLGNLRVGDDPWQGVVSVDNGVGDVGDVTSSTNAQSMQVVFLEMIGGHARAFAKLYQKGLGAGAPTPLEDNAGFDAADLEVSMNANGVTIVAWRQYDGSGARRIYANLYTNLGVF